MQDLLEKLKEEILSELKKIQNSEQLEFWQAKYLSRKGEFSLFLKKIKDMVEADRKKLGFLANEAKSEIMKDFIEIKNKFEKNKKPTQSIDPTLPGAPRKKGSLNPLTLVQNELEDLFTSLGFKILDGPELESDYYCFEALNIPKNHPARDMQDTFYIDRKNKNNEYDLVMRTHTSPVQVRAMQKYGAPLKVVVPGRVFRSEAMDACHEHTFNQMEGLMIDKNISIANMIAVMIELLENIFDQKIKTRTRPGFFPFVEPGVELDIACTICNGKGCSACKNSGWLELLPAGMIHPKVLEYGGINPKEYSGFAFGLGLTRLVMMKYGISDIRLINSGDLRFLEQF